MANMFRRTAMNAASSPEQLDAAIKLTSPVGWGATVALGVIVVSIVIWGFVGTLPSRVTGLGMIFSKGAVVHRVKAPGSGRVESVAVVVEQMVKKGDVLAIISQPKADQNLDFVTLDIVKAKEELDLFKKNFQQEKDTRTKTSEGIIASLKKKLSALNGQEVYLRSLVSNLKKDLNSGLVTRQDYENSLNQLHTVEAQTSEASISIVKAEASLTSFIIGQERQVRELERNLLKFEESKLDLQNTIDEEKFIKSPVDGRVVGISIKAEDLIAGGGEVAIIYPHGAEKVVHAYFKISDGKKISPGMRVQTAPTSIESEIYGTVVGHVISVSEFPQSIEEIMNVIGNETVVRTMMADGAPIEVLIALENDPKTFSGLKWSSSTGPQATITPGTLASAAVTTQNEHPINLIVPIMKTWTGIGAGE